MPADRATSARIIGLLAAANRGAPFDAREDRESITLYHGSVRNFSRITQVGFDLELLPTWLTPHLDAALNSIGPHRVLGSGDVDQGIIGTILSRAAFEALQANGAISAYRAWTGFGGKKTFGEYVVRHREAIRLINSSPRFSVRAPLQIEPRP